jgi:hypothetical protein
MPSAPVAKYPPFQRPSRRFACYAVRTERAVLTDAYALAQGGRSLVRQPLCQTRLEAWNASSFDFGL